MDYERDLKAMTFEEIDYYINMSTMLYSHFLSKQIDNFTKNGAPMTFIKFHRAQKRANYRLIKQLNNPDFHITNTSENFK